MCSHFAVKMLQSDAEGQIQANWIWSKLEKTNWFLYMLLFFFVL